MHPPVSLSTLKPTGQILETMTDEERLRFRSAYCDLIEVCRHMEIKQGIRRHVIVGALLATVLTLGEGSDTLAEALDSMKVS